MNSRSLLWVSLPDQRPRRELHYMSLMPNTHVTALAKDEPQSDVTWIPSTYRRPIKRFIEAGALAWVRELADQNQSDFDWIATLELCSLVTGQSSSWRRNHVGKFGKPTHLQSPSIPPSAELCARRRSLTLHGRCSQRPPACQQV